MMKKCFVIATVVVMLVMGIGQIAQAADDYKSFGVRLRGIGVIPSSSTGGILSTLNTNVGGSVVPEIDLEYFFLKNFSAELIAAVTYHVIKLNGAASGDTWLLPPTLTVKYHPFAGSAISPYIGAGVNFTLPFDSHVNGVNDFKIDNSVGWAVQAGIDIQMAKNLFLNVDYKYVNLDTKATVLGSKYKLDLSPSIIGVGIGYRF